MKKNLIIYLILLSIFSVINIYYSRYYLGMYSNYFIKQLLWFILGFIIIYILSKVNISYILDKSFYLYLFGIFLLVMTLLLGSSANGSKSWLRLFNISIQASEFMKIFLILFLRKLTLNRNISDFKYLILSFIVVLIPSILVYMEPDTGPIISYIVIYISFIFLRGFNRYYYIFFCLIFCLFILIFIYLLKSNLLIKLFGSSIYYRLDRITNFINRDGYQISSALDSINKSKLFGIKKRVYFPEAPTDFAITLLISNFGLVGLVIYLILYNIFINILSKINKDKYIIKPFINFIIVQSSINILMNIGLCPIIGITYPLLSYGGSSIISIFILIGIIYNMDSYSQNFDMGNKA